MTVRFDHTIVFARDKRESAEFFRGVFGLPAPEAGGPFIVLRLADEVILQFAEPGVPFLPQHYAFLVDDPTFDRVLRELRDREIPHWADPQERTQGINRNHGGRGVYFRDPSGHGLEAMTRPYA